MGDRKQRQSVAKANDAIVNKKLIKFAKLRNEGELMKEISRVKEATKDYKAELICLENMRFAFDDNASRDAGCRSASVADSVVVEVKEAYLMKNDGINGESVSVSVCSESASFSNGKNDDE